MSRKDDKMLRISGETYAALREMAAASGETLKTVVARAVKAASEQRAAETNRRKEGKGAAVKVLDEMKERAAHLSATSPQESLSALVAADTLALILTLRSVLAAAERMREERDHYRLCALGLAAESDVSHGTNAEQAIHQAMGGQ